MTLTATETAEKQRFPDGFRILQGTREYITYMDRSSLRVWPSEVASHFEMHLHSAVEILLSHRGESVYQTPSGTYRVQPGEVLIIPPECPHTLTESAETRRYLLLFEPDLFQNLRDLPQPTALMDHPIYLTVASGLRKPASDLLSRVVDIYFRKEPYWNSECYALLLQMFVLLARDLTQRAQPVSEGGQSIDPIIMNSAITYISEHYKERITLNDVADFVGYSRCYFSRTFRKFAGVTFLEYLTAKRLNAASDMLMHSAKSINEIAREAGFGSVSSFNRVFLEQKNCSPTRYRALYGQAETEPDKHRANGHQKAFAAQK